MGKKLVRLGFLIQRTKVKGFKSISIHERRLEKIKNRSLVLPQFGFLGKDMWRYRERRGFPPY